MLEFLLTLALVVIGPFVVLGGIIVAFIPIAWMLTHLRGPGW